MGKYNGARTDSADFHSYCKFNNKIPYYTTIHDNEKISLLDDTGNEANSNDVRIESINSPLYITFNDDEDCLYIPAGQQYEINYITVNSFTVVGLAGQQLRYYWMSF